MAFYIGQKVVCVDVSRRSTLQPLRHFRTGAVHHLEGDLDGLSKGETYTIRGFGESWIDGGLTIHLNEIVRPLDSGGKVTGFAARRFRPVVERKTDISIFTQMLDDVGAGKVSAREAIVLTAKGCRPYL